MLLLCLVLWSHGWLSWGEVSTKSFSSHILDRLFWSSYLTFKTSPLAMLPYKLWHYLGLQSGDSCFVEKMWEVVWEESFDNHGMQLNLKNVWWSWTSLVLLCRKNVIYLLRWRGKKIVALCIAPLSFHTAVAKLEAENTFEKNPAALKWVEALSYHRNQLPRTSLLHHLSRTSGHRLITRGRKYNCENPVNLRVIPYTVIFWGSIFNLLV